jgi:excisionase family DNA binding protein
LENNTDTGYMRPAEVAALLRVHSRSVYSWLEAGILGGMKAGHIWLIPRSALAAFMVPNEAMQRLVDSGGASLLPPSASTSPPLSSSAGSASAPSSSPASSPGPAARVADLPPKPAPPASAGRAAASRRVPSLSELSTRSKPSPKPAPSRPVQPPQQPVKASSMAELSPQMTASSGERDITEAVAGSESVPAGGPTELLARMSAPSVNPLDRLKQKRNRR